MCTETLEGLQKFVRSDQERIDLKSDVNEREGVVLVRFLGK